MSGAAGNTGHGKRSPGCGPGTSSRQQALAVSGELARSGQAQRQGRAAQPGHRVKVKLDEDRVAPGTASSPP